MKSGVPGKRRPYGPTSYTYRAPTDMVCMKMAYIKEDVRKEPLQLAFFRNLQRAVIGPSATLTGR